MIKFFSNKIIFLVIYFSLFQYSEAQETRFFNKLDSSHRQHTAKSAFDEIENGISAGRATSLSSYLSSQTYLSLSNGINGYYSSNQAYYILEDFFKLYRVITFKLQSIRADEISPYAIGTYNFDYRGKRGTARVFVSLTKSGNNWKISQLTIN